MNFSPILLIENDSPHFEQIKKLNLDCISSLHSIFLIFFGSRENRDLFTKNDIHIDQMLTRLMASCFVTFIAAPLIQQPCPNKEKNDHFNALLNMFTEQSRECFLMMQTEQADLRTKN